MAFFFDTQWAALCDEASSKGVTLSVTSRFMSIATALTFGPPSPYSSWAMPVSQSASQLCHLMRSATRDNFGVTHCIAGMRWKETTTPGG